MSHIDFKANTLSSMVEQKKRKKTVELISSVTVLVSYGKQPRYCKQLPSPNCQQVMFELAKKIPVGFNGICV